MSMANVVEIYEINDMTVAFDSDPSKALLHWLLQHCITFLPKKEM
jgi:hypothetical protein